MSAQLLGRALGLVSLLIVAALFFLELENTSPGALSTSHAAVEELRGGRGCAQCHGELGASLRTSCAECHAEIEEQLGAERGFHGSLARTGSPTPAADCGACHGEHVGSGSQLVHQASFRLAGVESRESYGHEGLGFALEGRHEALACSECHSLADAPVLEEGQQRFLGSSQDCASCHEDPHEGGMASACADCHGQARPFAELDGFEHSSAFELDGAHGELACAECHAPGSERSVEASDRGLGTLAPRDCRACHESPHAAPRFLEPTARVAFAEAFQDCQACHTAHDTTFGILEHYRSADPEPTWHAATGFALDGSHAGLDCRQCHGGSGGHGASESSFEERFPGRAAQDCAVCHGDPHRGQFFERAAALGALDGRVATSVASAAELAAELERMSCLQCHRAEEFLPTTFGVEAHAHSDFPLFDSHLAVACGACHPSDSEGFQDFTSAPTECAACHTSEHASGLTMLSWGLGDPVADPSDWSRCDACHAPTRFGAVESFAHGDWTGFELDGAHAGAECLACHRPGDGHAAERGRLGAAHLTFGQPIERCSTCHADAHGGRIGQTSDGRSGEDCAECHDTAGFAPVEGLDHGAWFQFELAGAHGRLECAACHAQPAGGRQGGSDPLGDYVAARQLGLAVEAQPEQCGRCHADVHGGRFDEPAEQAAKSAGSAQSCGRCHGTESFGGLIVADSSASSFEHELWTGFGLGGVHATVACAACHGRLDAHPDFDPGRHPRLDAAPGRECFQCHADPHGGQFAEGAVNDCARCHTQTAGFVEGLAFDHGTHTRWPLGEQHDDLECAACHQPSRTKDGREIVRYTGLGTDCADCHGGSD
jgi:hypothetical protein